MRDNIYFRPAIPLLISLICGILVGSASAGHQLWAAVAVVICAGFCLRQIFQKKNTCVSPILLFASVGYLSIQPWVSPRLPADHILHYADTHQWEITGRVAQPPRKINNRTRFHLQVTSLGSNDQIRAVSGTLRATAIGDVPHLFPGDQIRFIGRIRSLTNFKNPGGFDYKRYMAFKGIRAAAYLKANTLVVINRHSEGGFSQITESARSTFSRLVDKSGHTQIQSVFKALIIGDRSQISSVHVVNRFDNAIGHPHTHDGQSKPQSSHK
jgi:competence protein ComEC